MGFTGFFKRPEHRRFNLQPRYWDPAKEEREERERRIRAELGMKDENGQYIPHIKGRMKSKLRHKYSGGERVRRKSNFMIFLIIIILLFVAYIYLYGWDGVL